MLAFLFENTIFGVQISFYNIYPYILAGFSETQEPQTFIQDYFFLFFIKCKM